MQDSECIIAVNKNDTAPIFEIADYGICGDLFKVTPLLTEAIRAAKAASVTSVCTSASLRVKAGFSMTQASAFA